MYDFATVESSAGVCHTIFRIPQPNRRVAQFGYAPSPDYAPKLVSLNIFLRRAV